MQAAPAELKVTELSELSAAQFAALSALQVTDAQAFHGKSFAESMTDWQSARPWQGRGWGHLAFDLAVAWLRQHWSDVTTLTLSVDADNAAALAVYRGAGLTDSGPQVRAGHGPEQHMRLPL